MNERGIIDIFVPSYHRPNNLQTIKKFKKLGYPMGHLWVFIDSATDDISEYEKTAKKDGFNLRIFDMEEARKRYDFVHRPSQSLRAAGLCRNMFQDEARKEGIEFYIVQDDDTHGFEIRTPKGSRSSTLEELVNVQAAIRDFMERHGIGFFALPQSGDIIGGLSLDKIRNRWYMRKVMNYTFYQTKFVYRAERGVQDDDTSMFVGAWNEGLFTGSLGWGLILHQTESAMQEGGLTDLYHENKLLNKALVCPIQFPSAIWAEKQIMNGGRLHHRINYKYLAPRIMKGERGNIAWDTWPEDIPYTNEPRLKRDWR